MDEIEKKFRIKQLPDGLKDCKSKKIIQGYLCNEPAIRVRQYDNEKWELTGKIKRDIDKTENTVRVNDEINIPLTESAFKSLLEKINDNVISKTRYYYPIDNDLIAEVDIFDGILDGLVIVEVEFPNYETACVFIPPEWFGEDISIDKRFTNSKLSRIKSIEELK